MPRCGFDSNASGEAMTDDDFRRLEGKVDKLSDAVTKLIVFEERQATQGQRIGEVEKEVAVAQSAVSRIDAKVERWINRGIGAWGVAAVVFALMQFGTKLLGK